jgi:hypothetical protein
MLPDSTCTWTSVRLRGGERQTGGGVAGLGGDRNAGLLLELLDVARRQGVGDREADDADALRDVIVHRQRHHGERHRRAVRHGVAVRIGDDRGDRGELGAVVVVDGGIVGGHRQPAGEAGGDRDDEAVGDDAALARGARIGARLGELLAEVGRNLGDHADGAEAAAGAQLDLRVAGPIGERGEAVAQVDVAGGAGLALLGGRAGARPRGALQ